jgi:hypothetical protein
MIESLGCSWSRGSTERRWLTKYANLRYFWVRRKIGILLPQSGLGNIRQMKNIQ